MKFVHLRFKKYVLVLALGVLIVGFLGDNSVVAHLNNKARINELKGEIAVNQAVTKANQERLYKLQSDPKAVEKVGRERYFMKHDDEDVFVLSDDEPLNDNAVDDETVE
ncbi:MAG: septum formation initiator family protein [Prevotella sp.]|nr:septum formation initiator family protein [Prevotella sp.]